MKHLVVIYKKRFSNLFLNIYNNIMRSTREMITLFIYLLLWIFAYKISDILFKN